MIYTVTLNPALDRELTVPAISFDSVLRATESRSDLGGKGFNVARMLAVLGQPVVAVGFAGGKTGEILREGLNGLGIPTEFVEITGETRTNVSIVTPAGDHHIKVNEAGPTISANEKLALEKLVQTRVQPGDWWVLAGSLPPGLAPTVYADLIRAIKAAGGRVILDTSGEPLRQGYLAGPDLLKPNTVEAAQLTGHFLDTPQAALRATRYLEGVEFVVVSMGKDGALLGWQGQGWWASAPTIVERNPIGAGDSLVAGLVAGLSQDSPLEALRLGVACGAATASHGGTAIGTRPEINELLEKVSLHELESV